MANITTTSATFDLPPLPDYTLKPLPPLLAGIPDIYLTMALPVIAYWVASLFFHVLDTMDLFPQYRLHTPAEVSKRNHVSRYEVFRDVIVQQVIQTIVGVTFAYWDEPPTYGKEEYDIAWWAQKVRLAQRAIPVVVGALGLDANGLASKIPGAHTALAGALAGGVYPHLTQTVLLSGQPIQAPAFASWELLIARAIYHVGIPFLQFTLGIFIVDTWQYFLHRAMHMNKWLYTTFHSRHHRLYVPYAYGALYNHPFEGFLLDTLGTGIAYLCAGMTTRQTMWFFTLSTIKTVDDHCGYAFPWDPLQHLTSNNAGYHDVHHQSWGIKTNFSQPFFTFWDGLLGTKWTGGDVSARYERARVAAQKKVDADARPVTGAKPVDTNVRPYSDDVRQASSTAQASMTASEPRISAGGKPAAQALASRQQILDDPAAGEEVLGEESAEERSAQQAAAQQHASTRRRQSPRKRSTSTGLKGLAGRVGHSLTGSGVQACGGLVVGDGADGRLR